MSTSPIPVSSSRRTVSSKAIGTVAPDRDPDHARPRASTDRARPPRRRRAPPPRGPRSARSSTCSSSDLATDLVLQLVGRALGDHGAHVDDGDPVGELVGLLEVLRREQQGRAFVLQLADEVPHVDPAARVEARSSARRGTGPRADPPGSRPGPAGGACRPSTSWPHGPRHRSGRTAPAPRRHGAAPPPSTGGTAVRRARGSRARSGSRRPRRSVPRGRCGTAAPRRRARVEPVHLRSPAGGREQVVRMLIAVVLPAPFGPSRPSTVPFSTSRSIPLSAWTSPKCLTSARCG